MPPTNTNKTMQKNTKEWIQYGSALGLLLSGVVLTFLCFFLNGYDIKDSVLWYVAQCLVYAGSVFGVTVYVSSKLGDVKKYFDDRVRSEHKQNGQTGQTD